MREKDRRFLVEGAQGLAEALEFRVRLESVFFTPGHAARLDELVSRSRSAGVPTFEVSNEVMARLTSTITPQGVVAVAPFVDVPLGAVPQGARCIPVLVEVRDPGNAGTIVRSADAAGADAVVFTRSSVDVYNEKTVRATAGSLFHLPVVRHADLQATVGELRARGMRVLATDAGGELAIDEVDVTTPAAVLFGNEAHGLPQEASALADVTVRVPIYGRAESLNLAAATALVLYEFARQRTEGGTIAAMVAGAAHDIRSPLGAILGFGTTLRSRWGSLDDAQKRSMIEAIVHDSGRMRREVAKLVDAARLASGQLRVSSGSVEVLELARAVAQDLHAPGGPDIEVGGEPVSVEGDAPRLRLAVTAMVEAATWWGEEGPVRITVDRGDGARVEVHRSGASVDEAAARDLLAPRRPGMEGGSKVGLYVARGVAAAHGGSLEVRAGDGITFTMTLRGTPGHPRGRRT